MDKQSFEEGNYQFIHSFPPVLEVRVIQQMRFLGYSNLEVTLQELCASPSLCSLDVHNTSSVFLIHAAAVVRQRLVQEVQVTEYADSVAHFHELNKMYLCSAYCSSDCMN